MQLAQVNIARALDEMDTPTMADFAAGLEEINALAEASPGFVWRLQSDDGDATSIRPYPDDDLMLINMSVWASVEALADYVYRTHHVAFLRRRHDWFERMSGVATALWWVLDGHEPTPQEAKERLAHLQAHGPTPYAFTFREPFAAPGVDEVILPADDWLCPA